MYSQEWLGGRIGILPAQGNWAIAGLTLVLARTVRKKYARIPML